jgi:hypothetical protein
MSHPAAIFDLAVNRADTYLRSLPLESSQRNLLEWHSRTRFVSRIPLEDILQALESRPKGLTQGLVHWQGGAEGGWVQGKARFP